MLAGTNQDIKVRAETDSKNLIAGLKGLASCNGRVPVLQDSNHPCGMVAGVRL